MNPLASALNDALSGTALEHLLSDLGRRMYFPKGIVAQSAEAKEKATRFNATVGMAYQNGEPMALGVIKEMLPGLTTAQSVAYAPTGGVKELRERWKREMVKKNPSLSEARTTLPMVVPGLTPGILVTADLFLDPGDVVVIPDLFWGNYRLIIEERQQAHIRTFPFFDDSGAFNREGFRYAVMEEAPKGKVAVLLNFPNNPAGYSPTRDDAAFVRDTLAEVAETAPTLAILDDAYFGLFYDSDTYTESLFAPLAQLHENLVAVKVDGATKEDFVWGFRVGFVTVAGLGLTEESMEAIQQKYMGAIRSAVSNSSNLSQHMLLKAMDHPRYEQDKQQAFELLQDRYAVLQEVLQDKETRAIVPELDPLPCNSGYFMSFRCRGFSAEKLRLALLDRGIGVISVQDKYLRVAFAGVDRENLPALYAEIFETAQAIS